MGRVERLPDEPIIISYQDLEMTIDTVRENRAKTEALIQDIDGPYCLIIDLHETTTDFLQMLTIMKESGRGKDNTISNHQNIMTFLVGSSHFITSFRNAMEKQHLGEMQIAVFPTLELAKEAARYQIKKFHSSV